MEVRLFVGYDEREEVGSHVFTSSVIENSSIPVGITHITRKAVAKIGKIAEGTNAFTVSRFLIPYFMGYRGVAIFCDGADMLMKGDIKDLIALFDPWKAVQVVKHDYKTKHPRKYVGTNMEADNHDYERKQWASMMLINCDHYAWRRINPDTARKDLLSFSWVPDFQIGEIPKEWNWLADEEGPNPDAKLLHWTAGVPGFPHYKDSPHSDEWFRQLSRVNHADY